MWVKVFLDKESGDCLSQAVPAESIAEPLSMQRYRSARAVSLIATTLKRTNFPKAFAKVTEAICAAGLTTP
jgi:hypothetical protein